MRDNLFFRVLHSGLLGGWIVMEILRNEVLKIVLMIKFRTIQKPYVNGTYINCAVPKGQISSLLVCMQQKHWFLL